MKNLLGLLVLLLLLVSCRYPREEGQISALKENTNLEVFTDSVALERLPVKNSFTYLHKGDRVVVAELNVHATDSVDSIWVKVAHSQEVQGWIRQSELVKNFVPSDSISQFIHFFSDTHASYFVIVFFVFVGVWLFRVFRKKQLQLVYFNDIDISNIISVKTE